MQRTDLFWQKKDFLKYSMPYAKIIEANTGNGLIPVCLMKDGGVMTTWSYCGPDLNATVPSELALLTLHLNNIFKEMDTGYVLYFEAQRHTSAAYRKDVHFPDPLTMLIDEEREALFSSGNYFESDYYCSLYCMPKTDIEDRMQDMIIEGREKKETTLRDAIEPFLNTAIKLVSLFQQFHVPAQFLDADGLLSYLHNAVSSTHYDIHMPKKPVLLDQIIYDTPLYGGLTTRLGNKHMRVIVPVKYASATAFGFFDLLNQLNFPYRWVTRYYALSKQDAIDSVGEIKTQWYGKIKSVMAMLKETLMGYSDDRNNNANAVSKFNEAADAITAIENDTCSYGYYSTFIVVTDDSEAVVEEKARIIINTLMNRGMTAKAEGFNGVEAWMGSLPGNVGHGIRRPMISTGNLVHMMPLSNIWPGDEYCRHLGGPSLIYTQTVGNTPFRLNLHVGNVGHSMLLGKTGGGKSVHLNLIEAQFRKYEDARVLIFDKGSSSIALTLGVGGQFFDLGSEVRKGKDRQGSGLSFQPLVHADDEHEQEWLLGWLTDFLISENIKVTPLMTKRIFAAIKTVASYQDRKLRRMTNLVNAINDRDLQTALAPLTVSGAYGRTFDSDHETLSFSNWQTFEMEKIMQNKLIVGTVLMYIFHRIEQILDGKPTLIVLDECWVFFENEQFAHKITEWLRVLRKYNASVLFATQEMETIVNSPIFETVNTNCDTKIFLPDKRGITENTLATYEKFGLNARQVDIIHEATLQHDYYYFSSQGARLYDLALEYCPLTLAYVAVGKKDVEMAKRIMRDYPQSEFNQRWLDYKNIRIEEVAS